MIECIYINDSRCPLAYDGCMTGNIEEPFTTVAEWFAYGLQQGWVVYGCMTHDVMLTEEEEEMFEEGDDPCIPVFRLTTVDS